MFISPPSQAQFLFWGSKNETIEFIVLKHTTKQFIRSWLPDSTVY